MRINFYFERKKGQSSPYSVPLLTSYSIKIRQHCRRYSVPNLLIKLLHCRLQWYVVGFFLFFLLDCLVLSLVMVIYLTRIIYIFIYFQCVFFETWCYDCGADQHMALKTCQKCNSTFEKRRKKDLVILKEKKTNITQQRHLMENCAC